MIALGNALTGVVSDVLSEDMENADANLASFKELYHQLSGLVPEWGDLYPSESLIQLEKAFRTVAGSKDPTPFMDALDKVESVCSSCHHSYMAAVHFKFHWRNFGDLTLKDPLNGKDIDIARLMQILNLGFSGSWIDFNQGQADASASRFQEFNAAFQSLKETCQECHGTSKRKYFVDENSQDLIDSYGTFLAGKSEDAKKVEAAMMAIGNEICFKCHLVHIPAAYSQVR